MTGTYPLLGTEALHHIKVKLDVDNTAALILLQDSGACNFKVVVTLNRRRPSLATTI